MKTALFKDIYREIRHSLPRFISIMLMISLGVFVYSGLKGATPLMRNTLDDFTAKTQMADIKIESALGLERSDISLILSDSEIAVSEFHHCLELNTSDSDLLVQIQSLPLRLSTPYLTKGRLPEHETEILLDESLYGNGYQIGQIVSFKKEVDKFRFSVDDKEDALHRYRFRIVGFCYHPEFIHPELKGEAGNGLGKLDAFAFVSIKNFNMKNYQFVRLRLRSTQNMVSENPIYKKIVTSGKDRITEKLRSRPKIRLRDLRVKAKNVIRENEKTLADSQKQLDDARTKLAITGKQIKDGEAKLDQQRQILNSRKKEAEAEIQIFRLQLMNAKETLESAEKRYLQGKQELEVAEADFIGGYQALQSGKKELTEKEASLQEAYRKITDGLLQIDKALNELEKSEKQLFVALSKLGINVEALKRQVIVALERNQIEILQMMGEAAMNYAVLYQKKLELSHQKIEFSKNKQEIENGLEQIAFELGKLNIAERDALKAKTEIENSKIALQHAERELQKGKAEYLAGLKQLESSEQDLYRQMEAAYQTIATAERELSLARRKYQDGKASFEEKEADANEKITDGKKQIKDAKKLIKALKESPYHVYTREDNNSYFLYYDSAKRMDFLSNIFPVFFFLIAMLVSLSTMTRMAEEYRGQIGTLKALGYGTWDITKKYFYYGFLSSLFGGIIGIAFGQPILSKVIYEAYNDAFVIKKPLFRFFWQHNIISILIGIGCTAFVALYVVRKHLQQNASALMRAKAPKGGTKIALEKITFVWKRMSFLQKVTARNMFRYKARMLMAIFGISGCTALVFLGFSLRDSVSKLLPVQFEELTHYEYLAIYDEDLSESATKDFHEYVNTSSDISAFSNLYLESVDWKKDEMATQKIQIVVPQNPKDFRLLQTLRNPEKKDELLHLKSTGAILTDKMAKLANIAIGDILEVKDMDNKTLQIPVMAISENYLGHYLYMTRDYYSRLFGKSPAWNAKAIRLHSNTSSDSAEAMVSKLLDFDIVLSVAETNFASAANNLESLDAIVGIMILLSLVLAFVVLYNLSNINISERMRELSTIKVLGFFPKELTAYVYRETFSLSIIGIGIGYVLGILLHKMILEVIVPDEFQLYPNIFPMTYVISAIMTLIFTSIVMIFVHLRLKRIDMVEALKSYE